jgi:zinc D-Ala-D-Ala dipeptidase
VGKGAFRGPEVRYRARAPLPTRSYFERLTAWAKSPWRRPRSKRLRTRFCPPYGGVVVLLALPSASAQPAPFVDAAAVVPGLAVDMRYFGTHNFVGRRIDGYEAPRCLLARQAANALALVERDLAPRGLGLEVFDCYRPARAVAHFARWARDLADQKQKAEFYPQTDKRILFRAGYIASRSGHSRGATVDLTVVRLEDGRELDMGTPFDFFGPQSWPSSRSVGEEPQRNRTLLADAMRRRGFRPYDREWWHFTLRGEPFPDTYFDFVVR